MPRVRTTHHELPKPNRRMAARRAKVEAGKAATGHRLTGRRAMALLVMLSVGLSVIILRLTQVQAVSASEYEKLGAGQRIRTIKLAAERGAIFDRNGVDLALSVNQQTVWANPKVVTDPAGHAAKLAPVLGMDRKVLADRLGQKTHAFVYLARKVDDATAEAVEKLELEGVGFVPESKRFYPSGPLAAPLLGNVGIDNDGLAGLEVQYDKKLAGKPGELVVEQDPQGRRIPQGFSRLEPARRGNDLILSLDQSLQYELERALVDAVSAATAKGGLAIVEDTRTGSILAMANVTGDGAGAARPSSQTEKNRAVTDVYEPGSTNKVITMAGALEDGLVTPETKFTVPDKLPMANAVFEDHEPHPPIPWSVTDILVNSSNTGTIMVGQKLGKTRLDHYLRAFGFGTKTNVGFPGEPAGLLLDPEHWYVTSMGTVPIGNGLAVSALQMLQVYVTLANGGMYKPPRLVEATIDADGVRHPVPVAEPRRVVSADTAGKLSSMLTQVVQTGTGTNAAVPGYLAAGKTGTARKPLEGARGYSGNYVASFVGFVPAQEPRLAAVVVLDEPTPIYGGQVSAPVFSRIMQYALRLERIPPPPGSPPVTPPGTPAGAVARALDEAGTNDDPNVPKATTSTTAAKKSAATTKKESKPVTQTSRATTPSPRASTTTTARGSTTKSTRESSTTTTSTARRRSSSASSSSTTSTTRAKSTSTTTTGPKRTTTTTRSGSRASAGTPSSSSNSTPSGTSGGRRDGTLGRTEGRSDRPSPRQSATR
ncbi:MAG TPA: penicillin-binding protein 2 [Acidimicrobiia bacterium]|nr:penicillin-binding protein 2 [Acidimicrobiia bacterium]